MSAIIVTVVEIVVSAFDCGRTEPEIFVSATSDQLDEICTGLLHEDRITIRAADESVQGDLVLHREASWQPPVDLMVQSDTVEGHLTWTGPGTFVVEVSCTPEAMIEFVDSVRAILGPNGSGHTHRETYLKDGSLCETFVSFIFGIA